MLKESDKDQIRPFTRIVATIVVPFLALAFLILYFFPEQSGEHFAWAINPPLTAMFMGAGYIGGAWLFVNAILGKRWHRVVGLLRFGLGGGSIHRGERARNLGGHGDLLQLGFPLVALLDAV